MMAPSHLTAAQIVRVLRPIMASQCSDYADVLWACHPQRIKRWMIKLGATRWHGTLMLESTAATEFINSHLVSEHFETLEPKT
jgi:hypothetical protein